MKGEFPYKLSITTVSRIDYYHPYHHHGIKPLAYNFLLEKASSIFGRHFQWDPPALIAPLQVDSFSHCAYLIHELRNRGLQLNLSSPGEMKVFFPHLLKRTKHFFRDALFLMSGYVGEEIPISAFRENFPSIDGDFPIKLLTFKKIFLEQEEKVDSLLAAYEVLLNTLSTAYDLLVTHVTQLTTESASQSASLMA
ncbi:hypothetical protein [unidentified bacterial endosymbiont]|uniref:hypothetical protein n=1 Tax=unidentified bacterial endosymbiont TaxID=2355 RepID=UPI00209FD9E1|nr:hypothetical protein [unidentified bacterial endosymbiont]